MMCAGEGFEEAKCLKRLVVLERATRREPQVPDALVRVRDVKSGDSTLTFFEPRAGGERLPEPS